MSKLLKFNRIVKRVISEVRFKFFERKLNEKTRFLHNENFKLAKKLSKNNSLDSDTVESDEIVEKGKSLRQKVLLEFKDKLKFKSDLKILIHVPPKEISPGGYSLFSNMLDSFNFLGVDARSIGWNENFKEHYEKFKPTHLITSDADSYISQFDWNFIDKKRKSDGLKTCITISDLSLEKTPFSSRKSHDVYSKIDIYYGFRASEYYKSRSIFNQVFENGQDIHSIEFGANPIYYYPVQVPEKQYDYVFLASSNYDKHKRYFKWFKFLTQKNYVGFIYGPGWSFSKVSLEKEYHRFAYANARIGINLHIDDSIKWASELNERTYILAACGVPQLIDDAKLLEKRFSKDSMFQAKNPEEYERMFKYVLDNPQEAKRRALLALEEVFNNHTTFHRAESFIGKIS